MPDDQKTQELLNIIFGPGTSRRLLFSPKETSELIGRAEQSLANDRFEGRGLPYVKWNRSVKYHLVDILTHIKAHRIDPSRRESGGHNGNVAAQ